MEIFFKNFADILDITEDQFSMDTFLTDLEEWDSLSVVSFAAMADIKYGKKLNASEIRKAQTVQDLFSLVGGA